MSGSLASSRTHAGTNRSVGTSRSEGTNRANAVFWTTRGITFSTLAFDGGESSTTAEAVFVLDEEFEIRDTTGYVEFEDGDGQIVEMETIPYEAGEIGTPERTSAE